MTPGVPPYVTAAADRALLLDLHRRYSGVVEAAYAAVCGDGGLAIALHTYLADVLSARRKDLRVLTAADLGLSESELGLAGSYTQVVKVFPPQPKKDGLKLEGLDPAAAAREIAAFLSSEGYVG